MVLLLLLLLYKIDRRKSIGTGKSGVVELELGGRRKLWRSVGLEVA
jgi:hypothetical protein